MIIASYAYRYRPSGTLIFYHSGTEVRPKMARRLSGPCPDIARTFGPRRSGRPLAEPWRPGRLPPHQRGALGRGVRMSAAVRRDCLRGRGGRWRGSSSVGGDGIRTASDPSSATARANGSRSASTMRACAWAASGGSCRSSCSSAPPSPRNVGHLQAGRGRLQPLARVSNYDGFVVVAPAPHFRGQDASMPLWRSGRRQAGKVRL